MSFAPSGRTRAMETCSRSRTTSKPNCLKAARTRDFEASTGNRGTSLHLCFRYEGFKDFRIIVNLRCAERLQVEPDRGGDVGQRFVVACALTNHTAANPKWIGDVAIHMLLHYNLEGAYRLSVLHGMTSKVVILETSLPLTVRAQNP